MSSSAALVLSLYVCATAALIAAMLGASHLLGGRRDSRAMRQPFESGMIPVGNARLRLPVQYYVIAMFFVIFDMEAAFVFVWAVVARRAGWGGYLSVLAFIGVLLAAFAYLWRVGALEWGPRPALRGPALQGPVLQGRSSQKTLPASDTRSI